MTMRQLELRTNTTVDVDGMLDRKNGVRFLGLATLMGHGTWRCLADVQGALCLVEVKIRQEAPST